MGAGERAAGQAQAAQVNTAGSPPGAGGVGGVALCATASVTAAGGSCPASRKRPTGRPAGVPRWGPVPSRVTVAFFPPLVSVMSPEAALSGPLIPFLPPALSRPCPFSAQSTKRAYPLECARASPAGRHHLWAGGNGHPRTAPRAHPFTQDPAVPPLTPPNTLAQLEEACRRLAEVSKPPKQR